MKYAKITEGYVVQTFDGTKCINQYFVASDVVTFENMNGDMITDIDDIKDNYHPFDMVRPELE